MSNLFLLLSAAQLQTATQEQKRTSLVVLGWGLFVLCRFVDVFYVFLIKKYKSDCVHQWWITRTIFNSFEQLSSPGLRDKHKLWFRLKMTINYLGISLLVAVVRAGGRDLAWGGEAGREGGEQPGEARGVSQAQVQEAGLQLQVRVQGGVHREEGLQDHLPIQVQGIQETGKD